MSAHAQLGPSNVAVENKAAPLAWLAEEAAPMQPRSMCRVCDSAAVLPLLLLLPLNVAAAAG